MFEKKCSGKKPVTYVSGKVFEKVEGSWGNLGGVWRENVINPPFENQIVANKRTEPTGALLAHVNPVGTDKSIGGLRAKEQLDAIVTLALREGKTGLAYWKEKKVTKGKGKEGKGKEGHLWEWIKLFGIYKIKFREVR